MTKSSNATKRALLVSALSIVMCLAMLIGTTFAWFTDTASTGLNKIQVGNLDVELEYSTDMENWQTATSKTQLFDDSTLWEPGYTQVVYLRVKNNGTLALKYSAGFTTNWGVQYGTNVKGEKYNITDYIKYGVADVTEKFANREDAQSAVEATAKTMDKLADQRFSDEMPVVKAGETSDAFALVIYMPTTVGNDANPISAAKKSYIFRLGVEIKATQATVEEDSFDNTYDENAPTGFRAADYGFSTGVHDVIGNIQADGGYGVTFASSIGSSAATVNVNANIYAVYSSAGGDDKAAMAVKAMGNGTVNITGGTYMQVDVPDGEECDLIYATGSSKINISGGTFRAANPVRTLNVLDGDSAKITVTGGSFYKYDPSHHTIGDGEVIIPDGYHVEQNGDWYTVVED